VEIRENGLVGAGGLDNSLLYHSNFLQAKTKVFCTEYEKKGFKVFFIVGEVSIFWVFFGYEELHLDVMAERISGNACFFSYFFCVHRDGFMRVFDLGVSPTLIILT